MNALGSRTFEVTGRPCRWCAGYHTGACPAVKAIDYDQYNQVRRVEFHAPAEVERLRMALRRIHDAAQWYADNAQRADLVVEPLYCLRVEIPRMALDALESRCA